MQTDEKKSFTFEVKSGLAKLLAEENITMKHDATTKTAYFDIKSRVLCLPVWQNISEDLYDMLVVHEVGHALFTPLDKWMKGIDVIAAKHHGAAASEKIKNTIKAYINVVEDARIDKLQKRRYPGTKRNYVIGYKELNDDLDFFGLKNSDINSYCMIDRLNIYFKSSGLPIKFSPAERSFISRMENLETFEEVLALSDELYVAAQDEKEKAEASKDEPDTQEELPLEPLEADDDGEDVEIDINEEDLDDLMNSLDQQSSQEDNSGKKKVNVKVNVIPSEKKKETSEKEVDVVSPVKTLEAAENSSSKIVSAEKVTFVEATVPTINIKAVCDDFTVVMPQILKETKEARPTLWEESITKYNEWRRAESETISFMLKEFETRKAADSYSRIKTAKTGTIDMNKLVRYKFDDDLFKKVTVVPEGKNHGFILLMDWSGSMLSNLKNTVKQLLSLTIFCKRIGVPFEVYTFRTALTHGVDENFNSWKRNSDPLFINHDKTINFGVFKLRNVLSSRMNSSTYNIACQMMWFMADKFQPSCDTMHSTPLNPAILALSQILPEFKKKNKLQIVNAIILSDGASDYSGWNASVGYLVRANSKVMYILKDPTTKKTYFVENPSGYKMTATYLRVLKDRTDANIVGFYLHPSKSLGSLGWMLDSSITNSEANLNSWRDNKFFGIKNSSGYDEHYIIQATYNRDDDSELNVLPNMTAKAMTKNFIKFSLKKRANRVLLTSFITRIAGEMH